MDAQTDLANQRGQHARQKDAETAVGTARAAAAKPVLLAAVKAVDDTLRDAGGPGAAGGEVSFLHALMASQGAQTSRTHYPLSEPRGMPLRWFL